MLVPAQTHHCKDDDGFALELANPVACSNKIEHVAVGAVALVSSWD